MPFFWATNDGTPLHSCLPVGRFQVVDFRSPTRWTSKVGGFGLKLANMRAITHKLPRMRKTSG